MVTADMTGTVTAGTVTAGTVTAGTVTVGAITADATARLARAAGHAPGIVPRIAVDEPLELAAELARGTYGPVNRMDLIAELAAARLRGRGGAGFPAHVKWRAVVEADGPRVVVANGEEGEPSSYKDRWLLTHRPHLVLDGLLLAAATVGADRAVVYLSHAESARAVDAAIAEIDVPAGLRLDVHVVEPAYVAGEETAACRSISGGPALPLAKPPRVCDRGVDGRPTLVSNVETLAHAAWIARNGAAAYRAHGTADSPGTTLVTLTGACAAPGVYEVPFGLTVAELFELAGGFTSEPAGFVMGGWFGGLLGPAHAATICSYEAMRAAGSGLGCAAITALAASADPVAVAADITAWYAGESARQCGVCVRGTAAIRDAFARLRSGTATGTDQADLARWGQTLAGRGACALLDGAAAWARTVLAEFPRAVDRRRDDKEETTGKGASR